MTTSPTFACFNPRAREGRDSRRSRYCSRSARFNPRAREGRDRHEKALSQREMTFQSTRPRGARLAIATQAQYLLSFNPRAREGRDFEAIGYELTYTEVSIHAPARGATWRLRRKHNIC